MPKVVPLGWVHEFSSKPSELMYNTKVNYDGCVNFSAGVWLIYTSITINKNDSIWFLPKNTVNPTDCCIIVCYDFPAIGGSMIHSSSETYFYVYSNIPKCVVQIAPICLIVKEPYSKVLPNYIFNINRKMQENTLNKSTISWKAVCIKIA
jgi:hypothetical protein